MSDGSTRYWDAMIDNSEEILDELSPQELGSVLSTIFNKGVIPKGRSRDFFLRIAERNLDLCVR
jgi:hypothetical protein